MVRPANRRVLMDDVAARAGVSVTTVSHVLNRVPGKRIRRGSGFRAEYVLRAASDAGGGLGAARTLLDIDDPPQAIFCFNDRMAMGVYHAAHERGLRIPEDLFVVGFDNQPNIADGLFPNLTTVALPHYETGTWGVRTLVEQLTRPADSDPSQVALACPLIHRESVGPPPGQGSHRVTARHATPQAARPRGREAPRCPRPVSNRLIL